MNSDVKLLDDLAKMVRARILTHYRPDSCIASVKLLIDCAKEQGIALRPLKCLVIAMNPYVTKQFEDGLILSSEDLKRASTHPDGWSVGIMAAPTPALNDFGGHLIAATLDGNVIVDPSIDQVMRPEKGILTEAYAMALRNPLPFDKDWEFMVKIGPCLLHYSTQPEDTSYEGAPDWVNSEHHQRHHRRKIAIAMRRRQSPIKCGSILKTTD